MVYALCWCLLFYLLHVSSRQGRRIRQKANRLSTSIKKFTPAPCTRRLPRTSPGDCPICGMRLVEQKKQNPAAGTSPVKKTMYRSTMNPSEVSDKPGKDSMGMDMVPFETEEKPAAAPNRAGRHNHYPRTENTDGAHLWYRGNARYCKGTENLGAYCSG